MIDLELPAGKPFDVVGLGVTVVNELLVVPRVPEPDEKMDALALRTCGRRCGPEPTSGGR